jgi:HTH-type transcriptional regulator, transcriptional repressor of NAD biosynthesis genes
MPLHAGHIALINFAADRSDEVIVSMSYTENDPIPYEKRFDWLTRTFESNRKIITQLILDDFDKPDLPLEQRTKLWAEAMVKVYPKIDFVFSSEAYGEPFARNLHAVHILFDEDRKLFPVSASKIRKRPFINWSFIPSSVRPYFVKKICFYGAESTGKSTMAKKMAAKYNTIFVPEVAREIITSNVFTIDDIVKIGNAHFHRIIDATHQANKILFCDTDVLTTQIYSQHYLDTIPPVLFALEHEMKYDQYFLFDIDVPWVADGLRDLGDARQEMHARFKDALNRRSLKFITVSGSWEERERCVTNEIDRLLRDQ